MTPVKAYAAINALPYQQNRSQNVLQPRLTVGRILFSTEISVFNSDPIGGGGGRGGTSIKSGLQSCKKPRFQSKDRPQLMCCHLQMLCKTRNKMSVDVFLPDVNALFMTANNQNNNNKHFM